MTDRENVLKGLEWILNDIEENGHYQVRYYANDIRKAIALLNKFIRSWRMIKFSVMDTANNNAGPDGNEDVYRILTWVATMMDNQEKGW